MTYNEKKSLYESIMKDVAKIVKRRINNINEDFLPGPEPEESYVIDEIKIKTKYGVFNAALIESNWFSKYIEISRNNKSFVINDEEIKEEDEESLFDDSIVINDEIYSTNEIMSIDNLKSLTSL